MSVCVFVFVCVCVRACVRACVCVCKAVADGPVGPVLAEPTFTHGKNKVLFYTRQIINKSSRIIFGLSRLVIS